MSAIMTYKLSDLNRANFNAKEFYHSNTALKKNIDNKPKEQATLANLCYLADRVQMVRNFLEKPMIITSGYRCEELNQSLSASAKDSFHLYGLAIDFVVKDLTPISIGKILKDKLICDKFIASYFWNKKTKTWTAWNHIQFNFKAAQDRDYYLIERIRNGEKQFLKI